MIDAPIGRHPSSRTKMAVLPKGKGREAVTHWRVIETFGRDEEPIASLVECTLETGRTHQVRVHLAHIGHPLIGDPLYGQGFKSKLRKLSEPLQALLATLDRQALHAEHLAFVHPESGTLLKFNSPLTADLGAIVAAFKQL
jgi:23S rRNA pseudouridine1911/1915/1917 synthase